MAEIKRYARNKIRTEMVKAKVFQRERESGRRALKWVGMRRHWKGSGRNGCCRMRGHRYLEQIDKRGY